MLFLFGVRTSVLKEDYLKNTTCPHCKSKDSIKLIVKGNYFHFFWIPILPLNKTITAECDHCRRHFKKKEFTEDMEHSKNVLLRVSPAKRPLWQGCGCLVLTVLFTIVMSLSLYGVYTRSKDTKEKTIIQDPNYNMLISDFKTLNDKTLVTENDSISGLLRNCINNEIVSGITTKNIAYFSKSKGEKLLILLKIKDIKNITPKYRKDILDVIEDCLKQTQLNTTFKKHYIGIEGRWNTVLVRTPTEENVTGRFADKKLLLPFYNEQDQ
ncbi:zinc-ribbon domain-containing protein [Cytophaga sp. FL35]|uniref:zinc-ribbon domain-containing protein n=1 Tax=Cytophaga sp. FL35 TaxID=1904456 RepID=UPI001653A8E2|nr:zinc-ribbon domain-containing protein [Cytophaga sp. FL35]MBC6999526.1 zinc-ribbon domain-containing protein [Cytophaga sp. FL35]